MMIKFKEGVFVRHSGGESILWGPRYDGCIVLQNCQLLLDEIGPDWRSADSIFAAMAQKAGIVFEETECDFKVIVDELVELGFICCKDFEGNVTEEREDESRIVCTNAEKSGMSVFASFCERNGILAELHIDLTDACTERCVHCYVPHGQHHFLHFELVQKAIREFRSMNGFTVHLTGGEAMLHPDFEKICTLCVELNLNLVIFSNMTLCDERRIKFLKQVAPQFINVSLYSMVASEHDSITQLPGSWQRTIDAILKACSAGVHCRIATPLLKENKNALPTLKRFADEHQMYFVPNCEIVAQADHECGNLSHACSRSELLEALKQYAAYFPYKPHIRRSSSIDDKVCDIGDGRLYLNALGEYYPCDCMHKYVVGNVRKNTIAEIWYGEKMNHLRSLKNRDFGVCAECTLRPWCKLCPAANYNATGDILKHHPSACDLASVMREVYDGLTEKE